MKFRSNLLLFALLIFTSESFGFPGTGRKYTPSGAPPFSPSIVQSANYNTGAGNIQNFNISLASNCTTGNLVVVVSGGRLSSDTVTSMSGLGATWTKAVSGSQTANNVEIWYGVCTTAGTTVTVNNSNTNIRSSFIIEISGLSSNTLDSVSTAGTTGGWGMAVPSFTTSNANTFVIAAGVVDKQATYSSISNSYVHDSTVDCGAGASRVTASFAHITLTSSGSTSTTITHTGTGSPTSTAIAAAFK